MPETIYNVLDRIEAAEQIEVEPEATSLQLLQAVYRNPDVALPVRMRAAGMAIPYEHPRLSINANVEAGKDFGLRLERAIARSSQSGTYAPRVIDAVATEVPQNPPVQLPVGPTKGLGFRRRI